MQCLRVQVATGLAYWTVVDDDYRPVAEVDAFLRHARLGRGRAEGTTENYARAVALFWQWKSVRDLAAAARDLDGFSLRTRTEVMTAGRAKGATRSAQRVNLILAAVREFYKHAVAHGHVDGKVLAQLYEVCDDRHLPAQLRPEGGGLAYVARPRHKLRAARPVSPVAASPVEVEMLLGAAGSARGPASDRGAGLLRFAGRGRLVLAPLRRPFGGAFTGVGLPSSRTPSAHPCRRLLPRCDHEGRRLHRPGP